MYSACQAGTVDGIIRTLRQAIGFYATSDTHPSTQDRIDYLEQHRYEVSDWSRGGDSNVCRQLTRPQAHRR